MAAKDTAERRAYRAMAIVDMGGRIASGQSAPLRRSTREAGAANVLSAATHLKTRGSATLRRFGISSAMAGFTTTSRPLTARIAQTG
jgi:hypothetical protein